jgi:hypothetical protein
MYGRCSRTCLGHTFAPLAFQKPRLGLLTEQTAPYTFIWVLARSWQLERDQDLTETNAIGVCVFIRRNVAAHGDEVSGPPEPTFPMVSLRNRPSGPRPPGIDPLADFEIHGLNRRFKGEGVRNSLPPSYVREVRGSVMLNTYGKASLSTYILYSYCTVHTYCGLCCVLQIRCAWLHIAAATR